MLDDWLFPGHFLKIFIGLYGISNVVDDTLMRFYLAADWLLQHNILEDVIPLD